MNEFLPCPFCGCTDIVDNSDSGTLVHCADCGVQTMRADWNRRAAPVGQKEGALPAQHPAGGYSTEQVGRMMEFYAGSTAAPSIPAGGPVAWKCEWFDDGGNWSQYHDENDPPPEKWEGRPPNLITPLYAAPAADPDAMERAARWADQWADPSHLRLHAGEMQAQELRTAIAVATGIAASIRGLKPEADPARTQEAEDAQRWRKCKRMPRAWWIQAIEEAGLKGGRSLDEIIDSAMAQEPNK